MSKAESDSLTTAQREIMEIIWDRGEVTVADVRKSLLVSRKVARNTVQTMLVRLEERGWITHREDGRTFVYSAKRPKTVSLGARISQMIDRLFAGSPEEMVTALLEYRGLSREEAKRIREMIRKAEGKERNQKSKRQ